MKKEIRIRGEGHTQTIVLEKGAGRCGEAVDGISYHITKPFKDKREPGGVMTNYDARRLMEAIQEHLEEHEE